MINLADPYRELHSARAFAGTTWRRYRNAFLAFLGPRAPGRPLILDFGCGPAGGIAAEPGLNVVAYDPYVEAYAAEPWGEPFEAFFSADVLEHLPEDAISDLAVRLCEAGSCKRAFAGVSTRPAEKTFPDGSNLHLIVRPADWWRLRLAEELRPGGFRLTLAAADRVNKRAAFGFTRG